MGFQIGFIFLGLLGEMIQFDQYFSNGLVQPPTSIFIGIIIHLLPSYQVPVSECPSMVVQSWQSRGNTTSSQYFLDLLPTWNSKANQISMDGGLVISNHCSMVQIWGSLIQLKQPLKSGALEFQAISSDLFPPGTVTSKCWIPHLESYPNGQTNSG